MFARRTWAALAIVVAAMGVVVARLIELQVVHADVYREQAAAILLLPPRTIPFVRGRILDRTGRVLTSEEADWEVKVDYGVLAMDPGYLDGLVRRFRDDGRYGEGLTEAEVEIALAHEIDRMWARMVEFSGEAPAALHGRADDICQRIRRIREGVSRRLGFETVIEEQRLPHAILTGLDDQQQVIARSSSDGFGDYPWVTVEAGTRRAHHQAECLAHVLGRVAPVDADQLANDPYANDDLRRYRGDEVVGVSGVEWTAENILRGRRGRQREDRRGESLEDIPPDNGRDVQLTLRYDLQEQLYDLLARELPRSPYSRGGVIVVLDVASRDVLALVSYPAYDPNRFGERYADLRRDTVGTPLRFRAVSNSYEPGSIVKPLTCLAGLSTGKITLETRLDCAGYLFPDHPDAPVSRCWQIAGTSTRKAHGLIDVVQALEGSCNVFMYRVGTAVGVDGLCNFFDFAHFGKRSGIGLREEALGINPTPSWLNKEAGRAVVQADARLFAIGQGEVQVTPLQAANLMATYAAGAYQPVRPIAGPGAATGERTGDEDTALRAVAQAAGENAADDATAPSPRWDLPVGAEAWRAIHQGLYAVVNSPDGTAHKYAHFQNPHYALAGKTGSATTNPQPTAYRLRYKDARGNEAVTILPAGDRGNAEKDFASLHPDCKLDRNATAVQETWPPGPPAEGGRHAHAWFAGYLQRLDAADRPLLEEQPRVAFAVLVEYGGSGGRASGPIAREVADILLDTLGDDLNPDAPPREEAAAEPGAPDARPDPNPRPRGDGT